MDCDIFAVFNYKCTLPFYNCTSHIWHHNTKQNGIYIFLPLVVSAFDSHVHSTSTGNYLAQPRFDCRYALSCLEFQAYCKKIAHKPINQSGSVRKSKDSNDLLTLRLVHSIQAILPNKQDPIWWTSYTVDHVDVASVRGHHVQSAFIEIIRNILPNSNRIKKAATMNK